jgi:hypothetical protein
MTINWWAVGTYCLVVLSAAVCVGVFWEVVK